MLQCKEATPGDLVTSSVNVSLMSDHDWATNDGASREVDRFQQKEVGLVLAVVVIGWPSTTSKQLLVLTRRMTLGWQGAGFFDHADPNKS